MGPLLCDRRYRLVRDVTNPYLDRRERYDVAKLAWTKGDVFRIRSENIANDLLPSDLIQFAGKSLTIWKAQPVWIQGSPRHVSGHVLLGWIDRPHRGATAALAEFIDALELVPESIDDILEHHWTSAEKVLAYFVKSKQLTLEDIRNAAAALQKKEDDHG
mgnify:CR=1 FL=1